MSRSVVCLSVLFFLLFASKADAFEENPTCQASYSSEIKDILSKIDLIEGYLIEYRWVERKIRHLFYERLWKARLDMNDPLDRDRRAQGREEEKRLLEVLEGFERKSSAASNNFAHGVDELLQAHADVANHCSETDYRYCVSEGFQPFYEVLREMRAEFNRLFESERDFREKVALKAAGREGFYPEDALEESDAHEDFYWRFEREHESVRFNENVKFMELFHEAHKILTWRFSADNCCIRCQKKD